MYERAWGRSNPMRPRDFARLIDASGTYPRLIVSAIEVPTKPKQFNSAEYVGRDRRFFNQTAILVYGMDGPHNCRVQFDNINLHRFHSHSWTIFPITDFFIHINS